MRNEILKYQRIRNLREDRDLSQREIAQYLNIKQNTYSRYETNDRAIPLEVMDQLAAFYGTSVDYLMGRTDNPKPYERSPYKITKKT